MSDAEEDALVLRPPLWSALLMVLVSALFVAVGMMMTLERPWAGFAIIAFFGLCGVFGIVQLFPGCTWLRISADGLTYCNLFRPRFIPWNVIREFQVVTMHRGSTLPGINFHSQVPGARRRRQLARALSGCDGALPSNYGMPAKRLVDLLNECLEKFTSDPPVVD